MRGMKILVIALMAVLWCGAGYGGEAAVGTVTYLEGRSDIAHGANEAAFAKEGDQVFLRDRLRTKSHSKLEITFLDKSVVRLAPNTCIAIEEYRVDAKNRRENARVNLTRGKIQAVVSKTGSPETFIIATPNASGRVKGSDIFVFYQSGKTGVFVKEGHISVLNQLRPEKEVDVVKGDSTIISFKEPPAEARPYLDAELSRYVKDVEPTVAVKKWVPPKEATKMNGIITAMSGGVRVRPAGKADWHYARMNEMLAEGDRVVTAEDGRTEIRIDNGNVLSLQPNSEIVIKVLRRDPKTGEYENSFESSAGKIKAIVEKLGKNSTFQVKTPTAMCGVRGTVMYLDVQQSATTAYYEGGYGAMTSAVSGDTKMVDSGQHSSADAAGGISNPVTTTNEARLAMDESWQGGQAAEGYSTPGSNTAPQGDAKPSPVPIQTQVTNFTGTDGTGGAKTDKPFDRLPFNEVVPPPSPPPPNEEVLAEHRSFIASFGHVGVVGGRALLTGLAGRFDGEFDFARFGSLTWSGTSSSGTMSGPYTNPNGDRLWAGNIQGTSEELGRYQGWLRGNKVAGNVKGAFAAIYIDPSGHGGSLTSYIEGTCDAAAISAPGPSDIYVTKREALGMLPKDLFTVGKEESIISGRGSGDFSGLGNITCGGVGSLDSLGGRTLSIAGKHWGIWNIDAKGSYAGSTNDIWKLAVGGETEFANPDKGAWLGTISGNQWSGSNLRGFFCDGVWLSKANDDPADHRVIAGTISNGNIVGDYSGATFTWEATGAGEWAEETDLLSETTLGFTVADPGGLKDFVSVPISETYATVLYIPQPGSTVNFTTATMDLHFYNNGTDRIWTGVADGTFTGSVPNNWTLNLSDGTNSLEMHGDQWNNGQWHATVVNGMAPAQPPDATFSGDAGGTYKDNGTFKGVAAGKWQSVT